MALGGMKRITVADGSQNMSVVCMTTFSWITLMQKLLLCCVLLECEAAQWLIQHECEAAQWLIQHELRSTSA